MKLSELKAPQMVSVAVKDGHDSFFKITFVISLSQKKKKHDLSHFWYVSNRPVIIRRPGKGGDANKDDHIFVGCTFVFVNIFLS